MQCSDASRSFVKEMSALRMSGWPLEVDYDQLRGSSKLILFTTTQEVAEEPSVDCSVVIQHLKQIEKVKSTISGCLMSWQKIKKIIVLKYHLLLLYATTMNHFSIGLWHVMKSGFYAIISDDQLSAWTKKFQSISQRQTCTKIPSRSVWWSASGLILHSFLSPSETIASEKYAQ